MLPSADLRGHLENKFALAFLPCIDRLKVCHYLAIFIYSTTKIVSNTYSPFSLLFPQRLVHGGNTINILVTQ